MSNIHIYMVLATTSGYVFFPCPRCFIFGQEPLVTNLLYTHVYICSKVTNSQFSCKYIYRKTTNYSLHLIKVGGKERIKNYRLQK